MDSKLEPLLLKSDKISRKKLPNIVSPQQTKLELQPKPRPARYPSPRKGPDESKTPRRDLKSSNSKHYRPDSSGKGSFRISANVWEPQIGEDVVIDLEEDESSDDYSDQLLRLPNAGNRKNNVQKKKQLLRPDSELVDLKLLSSGRIHHSAGGIQMYRRRIPEFESHSGSPTENSITSVENLHPFNVSMHHGIPATTNQDQQDEPKKGKRPSSFFNLLRSKAFKMNEAVALWEAYKSEPQQQNAPLRPGIQELLGLSPAPEIPYGQFGNKEVEIDPGKFNAEKDNSGYRPGNRTLGVWNGVFMHNTLHSFGGVMFLRLGLVFGNQGLLYGSLAILACAAVVLITACSFAAIVSNTDIESGGLYRMLSRSLGPKIGGVIGIIFVLSSSLSIGVFCLALSVTLVRSIGVSLSGNAEVDIRFYAVLSIILLIALYLKGLTWSIKFERVFFFIVIASFVSILIGCLAISPNSELGITGFRFSTINSNLKRPPDPDYGLADTIGIFFPALTGISSGGLLMSQLIDPRTTLANGTVIAAAFSPMVYLVLGWFLGATMTITSLSDTSFIPLVQVSLWDPIVYAAIIASAISPAIIALNTAPRVLKTIAKDRVFPFMGFFLKSSTKGNIPLTALIPVVLVTVLTVFTGRINFIAPYLTTTSLLLYALINASCFVSSMFGSASWRPTFRYYNKWVSLLGVALCLIMMIRMNLMMSLFAFFICIFILKVRA